MRAIAIEGFGDRDRMGLVEMPIPETGSDEVLVRIRASAGVGPWDVKTREGLFGGRRFPRVLGMEASGVVEGVGENVGDLSEGEEAGGAPVAGTTAHQGLVEEIGLKEGETVLIAGASGGVGTMAVQVSASLGARVLATASPANHDYLRSLGAAEALDYHWDWVAAANAVTPGGVDALFDCAGGDTFQRGFGAVRDQGRLVTIVAFDEQAPEERGIASHAFSARSDRGKLQRLSQMFDSGELRVELAETLALEEAARAHELVETGTPAARSC